MASGRQRPVAVVDLRRCTGCGWCVPACPFQLLSLQVQVQSSEPWKKTSVLSDPAACPGCRLCVPRCPFGALSVRPGETHAPHALHMPLAPSPPVSPDADGGVLP